MKKKLLTKKSIKKDVSDYTYKNITIKNGKINFFKYKNQKNKQPEETILFNIFQNHNPDIRNNISLHGLISLSDVYKTMNFIKQPTNLNNLKVSKIIAINRTFNSAIFSNDSDINNWDTKNIIYMKQTFMNIKTFPLTLNKWIMHNVYLTSYMFFNIENFTGNIENFTFKKIENMEKMFKHTNINKNFNSWKFKKTKDETEAILPIDALEIFSHCPKQTNTFQSWDFNKFNLNVGVFYHCPKMIPSSKNFYTTYSLEFIYDILKKRNIYKYLEKYKKYISQGKLNNVLYLFQEQNQKSKYYKQYIHLMKKL